jgi:hypothetical protein
VLASPRVDAAGTWQGEFQYETAAEGSPVAFTMRLAQDARGVVSGTVTEGPRGAPEEGRIIGTCRRGRLQFLKLMPVAHVVSMDGTQALSAFLAAAGYEADGPIEHPQLLYQGRLGIDGRTVAGTWHLDAYNVPLKGGQALYMCGGQGTWSARRVDA